MKYKIAYFLLLSFLLMTNTSCAQKKSRTKMIAQEVEIHLTYTSSYCGGAAPPEGMLEEYARPKPYPSKIVFFRKDSNILSSPILLTQKSDSLGFLKVKLPPGKYVIVDEKKKDKKLYDEICSKYKNGYENTGPVDKTCLLKYMNSSDLIIVVRPVQNTKKQIFTLNYHQDCNWAKIPCASYTGMLPH